MSIIWIDIWNVQSGIKVKDLINRCFNIGSYIAMIRGVNINLEVSQYNNYTIFSCRIQGFKCIKYKKPHKSKHHCYFTWCCKANLKTNPSRLKTKQEELCSHSFKYLNCHGNYQADSNQYFF